MIPLTTQDDLDKAVELLDRSVHMKSLKILLVLQNLSQVSRLSRRVAEAQEKLEAYNLNMFSPELFLRYGPFAIS